MIFRHFSALRILNGKFEWRLRKCLFSVTKAAAPVHSTYAAIKASAGFKPSNSYLTPNSNGTTKSSSILARFITNSINSLNSSGVKWRPTSSTTNRGIRIECIGNESRIVSISVLEDGFFKIPKAKIYSLESRTSNKFFIPDFFSCFAQGINYFFFAHLREWVFPFRHKFTQFSKMLFRLFDIWFYAHNHHLCLKTTTSQKIRSNIQKLYKSMGIKVRKGEAIFSFKNFKKSLLT